MVTVNRHHTPFLLNNTCPPCTAFGVCIWFSFLCPPRLNLSLFSVISVGKLINLGLEQQKSRLHIPHRGEGHTGSKPGCIFRGQELICSGRLPKNSVISTFRFIAEGFHCRYKFRCQVFCPRELSSWNLLPFECSDCLHRFFSANWWL